MSFGQKLQAFLGLDTSEYDSKLKGAKSSMGAFGTAVAKIGGMIAAAFSIQAIVNFSRESMKLAAEAEGVKNAFAKISGSAGVMNSMLRATRGAMDNSDLMALAIKARNFNIPLQDMSKYLEFATNRAITTGKSVEELTELIITGLGRKSSRSFIQLGLSAKEVQEAFKSNLGIMPLINRELEKMGAVGDTAAIKFGRLAASVKNLKEAWGDFLNNSKFVNDIVAGTALTLEKFADKRLSFMQKLIISGKEYKAWSDKEAAIDERIAGFAEKKLEIIKKTTEEIKAETEALKKLKEEQNIKYFGTGNLSMPEMIPSTRKAGSFTEAITPGLVGGPNTPGRNNLSVSEWDESLKMIPEGLEEAQNALIGLADTFAGFFSDVNLGFQGMIDGVITGIKRLIAELVAKAVFLAILSAIFQGAAVSFTLSNVLGGNIGKLVGKSAGGAVGSATGAALNSGGMNGQLRTELSGKNIAIVLERYYSDMS